MRPMRISSIMNNHGYAYGHQWRSLATSSAAIPAAATVETASTSTSTANPSESKNNSNTGGNSGSSGKKKRGIIGRIVRGTALATILGTTTFLVGGSYYLTSTAEAEAQAVNGSESAEALTATQRATLAIRGLDRALAAVYCGTRIGIDYKWSLRGIEEKSDEYKRVRSAVHLRSAKRMLALAERNRGVYVKVFTMTPSISCHVSCV